MPKKVNRTPLAKPTSSAKSKGETASAAQGEVKGTEGKALTLSALILENGTCPFEDWFKDIRDTRTKQRIQVRLDRIECGNLGEYATVGEGVSEFKLNFGSGYRIYFGRTGTTLIVLLVGGDKSTQDNDIKTARQFWKDYRNDIERHQRDFRR